MTESQQDLWDSIKAIRLDIELLESDDLGAVEDQLALAIDALDRAQGILEGTE